MAQDFFNGKGASFGINGQNFVGNDGWEVDRSPAELRTDNTAGGGCSDRILGSDDLKITLEMNWDASANPLDTPQSLDVNQILTNAKFYLNGTSSPFWLMPKAIVISATNPAKVGEKVSYKAVIANKGAFTRPTGNFVPQ